jgi:uncharacterized protein YjiS (DUF1127 family)
MQNTLHLLVLSRRALPSFGWLALSSTLALWRERRRSRRQLADLDSRALADIGVSHAEQWAECCKPFWK